MNEFYRALFDTDPHREGTRASKWDAREKVFGVKDVIPLWVADMDFPTVPQVTEALIERAKHPCYGYTDYDGFSEAEIGWLKRRHGVCLKPEEILFSPGVVDSMAFAFGALTEPGDRVLIQTPVYGPFHLVPDKMKRELWKSPLIERDENGHAWQMDFDDMERALKDGVRCMLLCNPHNPVGRVWTREELQTTLDLAAKYDCRVIVDEIHADFQLPGAKTVRVHTLNNSENCVVLASATKTFNLAGLRASSIHVKNPALREKLQAEIDRAHAGSPNLFGAIAQKVAYETGDEWVDALNEYLGETRDLANQYIAEQLPEIGVHPLEGTYLMWLNLEKFGMQRDELKAFLYEKCKAGIQDGLFFGEAGKNHMRMNLATQRRNVLTALASIRAQLDAR